MAQAGSTGLQNTSELKISDSEKIKSRFKRGMLSVIQEAKIPRTFPKIISELFKTESHFSTKSEKLLYNQQTLRFRDQKTWPT